MSRYYNTFLRNFGLFIIPLLLIPGVVAWQTTFLPNNTATASVTIEQPLYQQNYRSSDGHPWFTAAYNHTSYLNDQLGTLGFIDKIHQPALANGFKGNIFEFQKYLYKTLKIQAVGYSVISFQVNTPNPDLSLAIINTIVNEYVIMIKERTQKQSGQVLKLFEDQLNEVKAERDKAKQKVDEYASANPDVLIRIPSNPQTSVVPSFPQYEILVQVQAELVRRYNLMLDQYEQLKISLQGVAEGRTEFVKVIDRPAITSAFYFGPITQRVLAGLIGLVAALILVTIATLILTWSDRALWQRHYVSHQLGVRVLEVPLRRRFQLKHASAAIPSRQHVRRYRLRYWLKFVPIALVTLAASGALAWVISLDWILSLALLALVLLLLLVGRWPVFGLFTVITVVLFSEVFSNPDHISQYTSLLLTNLNSFTPIKVPLTPVETLLGLTGLVSFVHAGLRHERFFDRGLLAKLVLVFAGFLAWGYLWGVVIQRGDQQAAQWEVRALFYIPVLYFLTMYFMRDPHNWKILNWLFPLAIIPMCLITASRFTIYHDSFSWGHYTESLNGFNHETALLFVFLLMWTTVKFLFAGTITERIVGLLLVPPGLYCLFISERRAAFAVMAGCLAALLIILLIRRFRVFLVCVIGLAIVIPAYFLVFGEDTGPAGLAARAYNSANAEKGSRDYNSDLFRKIEKQNVQKSVAQAPLLGIGFGQKFTRFEQALDLSGFVWQDYTPHIQILWLWLKVGVGGWAVFWLIIGLVLFKLGQLVRFGQLGHQVTSCILAGMIIIGIIIFSYVDLGLYNTRMMLLTGVSIGLIETAYRMQLKSRLPAAPAEPAQPAAPTRELAEVG